MNQSLWYKNAIIYQLYIRAFYDSNGDGHGDIVASPKSWIISKSWAWIASG